MANQEHLDIFWQSADIWNQWRADNPNITPDLSYADLSGVDLSDSTFSGDMSYANLSGVDLTKATFFYVNLSGAIFQKTNFIRSVFIPNKPAGFAQAYAHIGSYKNFDLGNTNLSHANLSNSNMTNFLFSSSVIFTETRFEKANIIEAIFKEFNFEQIDLSGANLIELDLRSFKLKSYCLMNCDLSKSDLSGMDLSNINFESANLSSTKIIRANLSYANLTKATLKNVDLSQANLNYAKFNEADCEDINLNEADLSYSCFFKANMRHANLYSSKCYQTDFSEANLESSLFTNSECLRAKFYKSNLRFAGFKMANIASANFQKANLQNSFLYAANAIDCDFSEADLTDALSGAMRGIDANLCGATLTGVCIEDWNINANTNLQDIKCDYIYNKSGWDEDGNFLPLERLPHDTKINFKEGEFEKFIQKAQNVVNLIFHDIIDWNAFSQTFFQLEVTDPDAKAKVLGINFRNNLLVVTVEVSNARIVSDYHKSFMEGYSFAKQELVPQYEASLKVKDQQINSLIQKVGLTNITQSIQNAYGVTGSTPNQIINPSQTNIIEGGYNEEE